MANLDRLSLITVPISLCYNDTHLADATAFVWAKGQLRFLVTNWHNVTGVNPDTGLNVDEKKGGRPNKLIARFCPKSYLEGSGPSLVWKEGTALDLLDAEGAPKWLVHPAREPGSPFYGGAQPRADIAVIPLPDLSGSALFAANEYASDNASIEVGMDVFILGYPFAASPPFLPIWKRGSIASEPELVMHSGGYYFVDSASRPGMSGSPVVLRRRAVGREVGAAPRDTLIGIYSGRLSALKEETQIARVWHVSLIKDIIDAGRLGRLP